MLVSTIRRNSIATQLRKSDRKSAHVAKESKMAACQKRRASGKSQYTPPAALSMYISPELEDKREGRKKAGASCHSAASERPWHLWPTLSSSGSTALRSPCCPTLLCNRLTAQVYLTQQLRSQRSTQLALGRRKYGPANRSTNWQNA